MPQTYSPKSFSPMARNFSVSENSWGDSDLLKTIPRHASLPATHQSSGNFAKYSTQVYQLSRVINAISYLPAYCMSLIVFMYILPFSNFFFQRVNNITRCPYKSSIESYRHLLFTLSRSSIRSGPSCKCTGLHSLWFTPHMTAWAHAA